MMRRYTYGILVIIMAAICLADFQPALQAKMQGKSKHRSGYASKPDKEKIDEEKGQVLGSYYKLPLYFMENQGQLDSQVSYYSKLPGHSIYFTRDKIVFELTRKLKTEEKWEKEKAGHEGLRDKNKGSMERLAFNLKLET